MGFDLLSHNGISGARPWHFREPALSAAEGAGSDAACATFFDRSVMLTFLTPALAKDARMRHPLSERGLGDQRQRVRPPADRFRDHSRFCSTLPTAFGKIALDSVRVVQIPVC